MKFIKRLTSRVMKRHPLRLNLSLKERIENLNRPIWLSYIALLVIGFLAIMSAKGQPTDIVQTWYSAVMIKQLVIIAISLVVTFSVQLFVPYFIKNHALMWIGFVILMALLLLVLIVGQKVNGAKSWLMIGGFQLQPSEFVKPFLIWWLSVSFVDLKKNKFAMSDGLSFFFEKLPKKESHQRWFVYSVPLMFLIFIIGQPDIGTFAIIVTLCWLLFFISNRFKYDLHFTIGFLLLGIGVIWFVPLSILKFMPPHIFSRFLAFREPFLHTNGPSFQVIRGIMAVSRGGLIGVGPGASLFKTGYLPEASTDFIMAIVAEEYGLIGVTVVLSILVFLINYLFYQALTANTILNKYILFGVGALFFLQSFINLGGMIGLIPLTGVTLPFISYGGSSSLSSSLALGLALGSIEYEKEQLRIGRQMKTKQLTRSRLSRKEEL
ncbi:FtsW/RodA/SpoVE family cell cycle protein [Atopobacter phocae]|uniref:FtsW/RodA/SpoVE family cell cycle protein n=1 Tax=Atopobacter phocae TaxID=136492 RepID=UPI000550F7AB|nr:FtsW/RodA/SpoVE family cell cycle protein [Atopobacter phocae]